MFTRSQQIIEAQISKFRLSEECDATIQSLEQRTRPRLDFSLEFYIDVLIIQRPNLYADNADCQQKVAEVVQLVKFAVNRTYTNNTALLVKLQLLLTKLLILQGNHGEAISICLSAFCQIERAISYLQKDAPQ